MVAIVIDQMAKLSILVPFFRASADGERDRQVLKAKRGDR
jgi:hypothetical protein